MITEFQKRRDYLVGAINKIDGISCPTPGGAFYVYVDVSKTGLSGEGFAALLLKSGVGVIPGTAFGNSGQSFVRISYASSMEILQKAMQRIETAVVEHMKNR